MRSARAHREGSRALALALVGIAACGRIGFDSVPNSADAQSLSGTSMLDAGAGDTSNVPDVSASAPTGVGIDGARVDVAMVDAPPVGAAPVDTAPIDTAVPGLVDAPVPMFVDTAMALPIDVPTPDAPDPLPIDAPIPVVVDAPTSDGPDPLPVDAAPPDGPDPVDATTTVDTQPDLATACGAGLTGLLFCEDFENGLPVSAANFGYVSTPNGSVALATNIVRSGTRAAHLRVGDVSPVYNARPAHFYQRFATPLTQGQIYIRMFFYMPSDFTAPPWNVLVELTQANSGTNRVKVVQEANDAFGFAVYTSKDDYSYRGPNAFQRNRWHCLEMAVTLANGNNGRVEYFLDGQSMATLAMVDTAATGGWEGFNFGAIANPTGVGVNMYVDDVAIATSRIGCK